jgi:hypothetical protein
MDTVAEVLDWFAAHGISGSQRVEYRFAQPAAYVGRRDSSGEFEVLENAVFVFRTPDDHWRVDRYLFGGKREGVDLGTAEEATRIALAFIVSGQWPTSVVAREF